MTTPHHETPLPYRLPEYATAYAGTVECRGAAPIPVFVRTIDHVGLQDGCLPWPYIDITEREKTALSNEFSELVSLTGVLAPSLTCPLLTSDTTAVVPFKTHFIFDPELGLLNLSRKSRSNLSSGRRVWEPAEASSLEGWATFADLYKELIDRRNLAGGPFDFESEHFLRLSRLPWMTIFGVRNNAGWGAMACGARHGNELHLLHIVVSGRGLTSNASYVLMNDLISHSIENNIKLFLGGVPGAGALDEGVLRFKQRWSNHALPSWLLKMIIRPEIYGTLALPGNAYFPAYRFASKLS